MKRTAALLLALLMLAGLCPFSYAEEGYSVLVTDESGNPAAGVKVQLCTESVCFVGETGDNGVAEFADLDAGEYEVHILRVPEGFEKNGEVQKTDIGGGQLTFVLKAAGGYPEPAKTYASLDDVDFEDYRLVLVNYWEPWCRWCLAEMPDLEKLWQEYRDKGLLIIGVYHDGYGAENVLAKLNITYPNIQSGELSEYTADGVPVSVFYDGERNILPCMPEDYLDILIQSVRENIRAYLNGEFDMFTDEISTAFKKELDEIMDDEEKIYDYALAIAEGYVEDNGSFLGCSDYESWKTRIENRLD